MTANNVVPTSANSKEAEEVLMPNRALGISPGSLIWLPRTGCIGFKVLISKRDYYAESPTKPFPGYIHQLH